jgi:serine/threonine protein kinase
MPLNDSFKNRSGPEKILKLSAVPTPDELIHSMATAQKALRRPVFLAWQVNEDKRLLAITFGMDPNGIAARWVLRDGHEPSSPIIWSHDTADALMIHTLISDTVSQTGPAAAIPEFLRPGQTEPASIAGTNSASVGAAATDKDYSKEAPGSTFAERYQIISEIGKGATSTVYKAKQILIGRTVALKLMHPHLLKEDVNKRRFEKEAKATASLSHPNLVLVHDFGTSPLGRPFIVMDFVDGPSLDDIVQDQGRLTSQQFVDVFTQCCRGLSHAHKKGLIHRDIKPSNIRLEQDDQGEVIAKILDFGIAKLFTQDEEALKMTDTGNVLGSPAFMSPEQSRAQNVDHRTDIYSLGVVMFHAATGILPFVGKDIFETLYKHIYDPTPTFASLDLPFRIPPAVETMIHKAMQKDPDQRYQNMESLQHDLQQLLSIANQASKSEVAIADDRATVHESAVQRQSYARLQIVFDNPNFPRQPDAIQMTELELLKEGKFITDVDLEKAQAITSRFGGQVHSMLVAEGKLDRSLYEVAKRCVALMNANLLDLGRAVILLSYSQRSRLDFDRAVEELGWNLS